MEEAYDLLDIEEFIDSKDIRLLYFSRPTCGVCIAMKPKIDDLLEHFGKVGSIYINLDRIPEASQRFSIYSLPGLLIYVNRKETIRLSRYFSLEEINEPLTRYYHLLYDTEQPND